MTEQAYVHFEFPVLERSVKYMGCSSSLGTQVGGGGLGGWCKQGPRSPCSHTAQPGPTQVLHHLCLSPGLPLPSVLEEMTRKKGLEEKTGKADFSSPVLCINFLKKIHLLACF